MAELEIERLRKEGWTVTDQGDHWQVSRTLTMIISKDCTPGGLDAAYDYLSRQRAALKRANDEAVASQEPHPR
jgi:hypothetical protein